MKTERKRTLAFLFLAFFLMMELGGLHVFAHDDAASLDDCEICHVLSLNHQTPYLPDDTVEIPSEKPQFVLLNNLRYGCQSLRSHGIYSYHQFSRPPPVL